MITSPFKQAARLLILLVALSGPTARATSPRPLPATTPWKLAELYKAPAFHWVDDKSPVRKLMYTGEPYGGKPTQVFAFYATPGTLAGDPSLDHDLPAVVLVHGGGGTAFREWAELWAKRGYAAIAMDLAGAEPIDDKNPHKQDSRTRLPDGGPGQSDVEKFGSIDKPVFDTVDKTRTAVTGISWGGYLTCIVAGVDSRFKAAVPVYGCGFLHEDSVWLPRFEKFTPPQRSRWIELWDPSRYLPHVSMPIFFVNGTNDFAYPLSSYMKSVHAAPGKKNIRITVNMPHSHPAGWAPAEIGLFIDQHLRGETPLPNISLPAIADGKITAMVDTKTSLKSAALHYTTDDQPINKHQWTTVDAELNGDLVTAPVPPAEAKMWFITVTDERDAIVGSEVIFAGQ
jgi:dienelactone hydrolase